MKKMKAATAKGCLPPFLAADHAKMHADKRAWQGKSRAGLGGTLTERERGGRGERGLGAGPCLASRSPPAPPTLNSAICSSVSWAIVVSE